jgi:hypothetical protein
MLDGMKDKTIDRNVPMVIFLTAVILAGLVTAGRDQNAAEKIRSWFAGDSGSAVENHK